MNKHGVIRKGKSLFFRVHIGKERRDLPIFPISDEQSIALFNILGDTKVVIEAAKILVAKIAFQVDVLVTPEVKSIPLAYEMSRLMEVPYIVARKVKKPYMWGAIEATVLSITTGKPQTLWLDGKDLKNLKEQRVLLVDDVVSTGSTFDGLEKLLASCQTKIVGRLAVFTEGDRERWKDVIAIGHLPIFSNSELKEQNG